MARKSKIDDLFIQLINKMLEKHGIDYNFIKENYAGKPEKKFFMDYSWNLEEEQEYKKWAIALVKKKLKYNQQVAEQEVSWFLLMFGLTTNNKKND